MRLAPHDLRLGLEAPVAATLGAMSATELTDAMPDLLLVVKRDGTAIAHAGGKAVAELRPGGAAESGASNPRWSAATAALVRQLVRKAIADRTPVEARFDNVVDIRGIRADEALTMVEVFLDRAIADDVEVVIVRHGHGSGALRKALREHLPHLGHAYRHRPGLSEEGGDAVTVVWVRG